MDMVTTRSRCVFYVEHKKVIEGLSFDDVLLIPQHGILDRRADADISTELIPGYKLDLPILSANMPSVTNSEMAISLYEAGGRGVIHRFQTIEEELQEYWDVKSAYANAPCAIGLEDWLDRAWRLAEEGCHIFVLDVAHGDCERVIDMLQAWEVFADDSLKIIVGNVATEDGARRLMEAGADAIKIGIGPGAACTTREVTGFGIPQITAIQNAVKARSFKYQTKIIADGGIKNSGDIVKALAAGADSVMIGRLLAGANEAPEPGIYYGNASSHVNNHNAPEGKYAEIEKTGPVKDTLKSLAWGIRSGLSYGGVSNLQELRLNAKFIKVSPLTALESSARI